MLWITFICSVYQHVVIPLIRIRICHFPKVQTARMHAMVLPAVKENDEISLDIGNSFAAKFSKYANRSEDFISTKKNFIYHQDSEPIALKPISYFLCDRDTLLLFKKIYGGKSITKADIENDSDVLQKFLETFKKAFTCLNR